MATLRMAKKVEILKKKKKNDSPNSSAGKTKL
jgi:hypothetical protein